MTEKAHSPRGFRGLLLHVAPALVYAVGIFYAGSLPSAEMPSFAMSDKVVHLVGFAIMQVLAFRAVRYLGPELLLKWQVLVAAAAAAVVGGALELYQMALVYRSAELLDWVSDTVGAIIAAGILWVVLRGSPGVGVAAQAAPGDSTSPAG